MAYYPKNFNSHVDLGTGILRYDDDHVQTTYLNLRTLSSLITELKIQAEFDLQDAINNVNAKSVKDQTLQILGMFASKILEGISVFFTAGTGPAWISMIVGRIASGIVNRVIADSEPGDDVQNKANEIRDGMLAIFDAVKYKIDKMTSNIEQHWTEVFNCEDYSNFGIKGDVRLCDLADKTDLFPDSTHTEHDDLLKYLGARLREIIVARLLPAKWHVKSYPIYWVKDYYVNQNESERHFDFDYNQYNPHTDDDFWAQRFDGIPDSGFPPAWIVGTDVNGKSSSEFLTFIKKVSTSMMGRYSSFWGYLEFNSSVDGNRHYYGNNVHTMVLADSEENPAPQSLSNWLFKDDVYGNSVKMSAIATREEVYKIWFN